MTFEDGINLVRRIARRYMLRYKFLREDIYSTALLSFIKTHKRKPNEQDGYYSTAIKRSVLRYVRRECKQSIKIQRPQISITEDELADKIGLSDPVDRQILSMFLTGHKRSEISTILKIPQRNIILRLTGMAERLKNGQT